MKAFGPFCFPPQRRQLKCCGQVPGANRALIAGKTKGGLTIDGVVTFHILDDRLTRIMVQMGYHPRGVLESAGNLLRVQPRRVRRDLRLFKHNLELAGQETGSWRGPSRRVRVRGRGPPAMGMESAAGVTPGEPGQPDVGPAGPVRVDAALRPGRGAAAPPVRDSESAAPRRKSPMRQGSGGLRTAAVRPRSPSHSPGETLRSRGTCLNPWTNPGRFPPTRSRSTSS